MVVDPTILPESLALSLVMVVPVAQQAMLSVMDDHTAPLMKQAFLLACGTTREAGSNVSGG